MLQLLLLHLFPLLSIYWHFILYYYFHFLLLLLWMLFITDDWLNDILGVCCCSVVAYNTIMSIHIVSIFIFHSFSVQFFFNSTSLNKFHYPHCCHFIYLLIFPHFFLLFHYIFLFVKIFFCMLEKVKGLYGVWCCMAYSWCCNLLELLCIEFSYKFL